MQDFGLTAEDLYFILERIESFPEIERAVIFGSRGKGNYKVSSDIDIGIFGADVNFDTVSSLTGRLENEGILPYFFDVVDVSHLEHKDLKEHIDRVGKEIFKR